MDIESIKKILSKSAFPVEYDGNTWYVTSNVNPDTYKAINDLKEKNITEVEAIDKVVLSVMCDSNGIRSFNESIKEHIQIVSSLDLDLKTEILMVACNALAGDKKKDLATLD
jgi:hypothetical protein